MRALETRDFRAAEEFFAGCRADARDHRPRALAAAQSAPRSAAGRVAGAMTRFEEVAKLAPAEGLDEASAKANYSLGVMMASAGQTNQAIQRLTAAVKYNPNYAEALMALGDTLRRGGRFEASLKPYGDVVRINPRAAEARFAYAMALVRCASIEMRSRARESAVSPDRPTCARLARLLAAAPTTPS